ncbi:GTP-binding protein [soil metagenome]
MAQGPDGRITTNLLTGFLGSGKTLLLSRLLQLPNLSDTAVLINEFGEFGLDHLLLERVDDDIVLLESGCICCTIRSDLKDAMVRLLGRMHRGDVPPFSRLVIETTGLADPAPIVATVNADIILRHHFRIGNVVTLVDAVSGRDNLANHPEAAKQVAVADRIVISKTDLASGPCVSRLRQQIGTLNPTAEIEQSSEDSRVAAGLLSDDIHSDRSRADVVERWLRASSDGHPHADHDGGIRAFSITSNSPLDWAAFGLWLSMLLNRHGTQVLRVKGLLNIIGTDKPVVVHGVQHTIHKPDHLESWPDGDIRSRIVFIVDGLDRDLLTRSFHAFCSLETVTPPPPSAFPQSSL